MRVMNQTLDQKELQFFLDLKEDLSLESEKEVVNLVTCVLQTLRQTLSLQNANTIINRLPDFLKLIFASNWRQHEEHIDVHHFNQFVSLVSARDRWQVLKNESSVVAVKLILKKLYQITGLENYEGLNRSLQRELINTMEIQV